MRQNSYPAILARAAISSTSSATVTSPSPSGQSSGNQLIKTVLQWVILVLAALGIVAAIVSARSRILRRRDRRSDPTAYFFSGSTHTPTSNSLPRTAHVRPYSAEPPDSPSYPPYPAIAHTHMHGRTVRALDTDEGGRRSGTSGDHDVRDKEALPAYDGFRGGPPKYEET